MAESRERRLRRWRNWWNGTGAKKIREKKRELGLCQVAFCTRDATGFYCELHRKRQSNTRKVTSLAICKVCYEPRRATETGICKTCTLLGRTAADVQGDPVYQEWERTVKAWKASGETMGDFASALGIKRETLRYWSDRFRRIERRERPEPAANVGQIPGWVTAKKREAKRGKK